MTVLKIVSAAISGVLVTGCVTTHTGPIQTFKDSNAKVSCELLGDPSMHNNDIALCNFENSTDKWQSFEVASVKFPDNTRIATPDETRFFLAAKKTRDAQERFNTDMAVVGVAAAGLVAIGGGGKSGGNLGIAMLSGASAANAGRRMASKHAEAKMPESEYGESNIVGPMFQLPEKSFVRRASVLMLGKADTPPTSVTLCFKKPSAECLNVALEEKWRVVPNRGRIKLEPSLATD